MFSKSIVSQNQFNTLVYEGCGARFASIVGAVSALEEAGIYSHIERIAASSGGAVPALFGALGMTSKEMMDVINDLDETKLFNRTRRSKIPLFGTPISIYTKLGISRSDNLIRFAKDLLEKRGFPRNLTFKQLAEMKAKNPQLRLKNIYLTAVNNSKQGGEFTVFSHENPETQNVEIAEAFAAALAYPGTVIPVKILTNGKFDDYSDGGARDNYPYAIFPREQWPRILGVKLDTLGEVFKFQRHNPGLLDYYFWNLVTDNHGIFMTYPNTTQVFDGGISVLKSVNPLDHYALYLSGKLAMTARLKQAYLKNGRVELPNKPKTNNEDNLPDNDPDAKIREARTKRYQKLMEDDASLSKYILPTHYLNLKLIYDELKTLKDDDFGCVVHYQALLDQLYKKPHWSAADYALTGYALTMIRRDLFVLLRERCERLALLPEARPSLISDVVLAYLHTNEYNKAYEFLCEVQKNAKLKLLGIDHLLILKMLGNSKSSSKEVEALKQLMEHHYECLLMTHPGALEAHLIAKFSALIEAKQYSHATCILAKMKRQLSKNRLEKACELAMQSFGQNAQQRAQLHAMFKTIDRPLYWKTPPLLSCAPRTYC